MYVKRAALPFVRNSYAIKDDTKASRNRPFGSKNKGFDKLGSFIAVDVTRCGKPVPVSLVESDCYQAIDLHGVN